MKGCSQSTRYQAVRFYGGGYPEKEIERRLSFSHRQPDLNPQEHAWIAVRKEVSHNQLEARPPELADCFLHKLNSSTL